MSKYKEKDRVCIHWEQTPFAKTAIRHTLNKTGVIEKIHSGNTKVHYVVAGYYARDETRVITLYENEISLYVGKVSEGDLL